MTPEENAPDKPAPAPQKLKLSLDMRLIVVMLLVVIAGMLALWRPWAGKPSTDRTVSVTGQAAIKAEPDEFLFYPTYRFSGTDQAAALAQLTKKSETVVGELKKLGVPDGKIKTDSSGSGDYYAITRDPDSGATTYTLRLTVTVGTRELAQKVQDYLATTAPTGSVSPQPSFSQAKQNELENQARDQATKDARAKADQSAKNLGFKVGKVKEVTDGAGFNTFPYGYGADSLQSAEDSSKSRLTVQPGENDLNYSVKVVYFLR